MFVEGFISSNKTEDFGLAIILLCLLIWLSKIVPYKLLVEKPKIYRYSTSVDLYLKYSSSDDGNIKVYLFSQKMAFLATDVTSIVE